MRRHARRAEALQSEVVHEPALAQKRSARSERRKVLRVDAPQGHSKPVPLLRLAKKPNAERSQPHWLRVVFEVANGDSGHLRAGCGQSRRRHVPRGDPLQR